MRAKKIDVTTTSYELAKYMHDDPNLIEKDLLKRGDNLIAVFEDDVKRKSFRDFDPMKIEVLKMAIEDLSTGGNILRTSTFGLIFNDGKVQSYIAPFGLQPSHEILFSINIKNQAAFKNWRTNEDNELAQDDLNAAIYGLTVAWSKLL